MSTPIARGSTASALLNFSLTMVCALYPLCAILLGNMTMAKDRPRGQTDVFAVLSAQEQGTIRE
jgi:hypothetical protein